MEVYRPRNAKEGWQPREAGEREEGSCLEPSERLWPGPHLGFRPSLQTVGD